MPTYRILVVLEGVNVTEQKYRCLLVKYCHANIHNNVKEIIRNTTEKQHARVIDLPKKCCAILKIKSCRYITSTSRGSGAFPPGAARREGCAESPQNGGCSPEPLADGRPCTTPSKSFSSRPTGSENRRGARRTGLQGGFLR